MTTVAVIPARSGSRRLVGKNIRPLATKPLIVWSIETARAANIDKIIVTTDGDDIASVASSAGVSVIMRPESLAQDSSETLPTVRHAVDGIDADTVVLLQPTSPLRLAADIEECISLHQSTNRPVISVTEDSQWLYWRSPDGAVCAVNKPAGVEAVHPNGAVYVCSRAGLSSEKAWWDSPLSYVMPKVRSIDIDTIDDFELAEAIISRRLVS